MQAVFMTGLVFLLALLVLAVGGCGTAVPAPWYVCGQRVIKETREPVMLCQPVDGGQIRQERGVPGAADDGA